MKKRSSPKPLTIDDRTIAVVSEFFASKKNGLVKAYTWQIPYDDLPKGVSINRKMSLFDQNIGLKMILMHVLQHASKKERHGIIDFYINKWGGIHGNSEKTMAFYSSASPRELMATGTKGIASWSKALSIQDPKTYAIFDARVSACLNALILKDIKRGRVFFPILQSRNTTIAPFNKTLRSRIAKAQERSFPPSVAYSAYLDLLTAVAKKNKVELSAVEMCLFTHAEELVKKVEKNQAFLSRFFDDGDRIVA